LQNTDTPEKEVFGIFTGSGNNGGDGFVIASELAAAGVPPAQIRLFCIAPVSRLKGDALSAWTDVPEIIRQNACYSVIKEKMTDITVVIDGLLGTGFRGELQTLYHDWISMINEMHAVVFSVDVPSGLNADDGQVTDIAVRADHTLTFALPKRGLLTDSGPSYCGRIRMCPIGIPREWLDSATGDLEAVDDAFAAACFPAEKRDCYKNEKGHALIIGGSAMYPNAPFLSGEAALRAAAGLVTVAVPKGADIHCTYPKALIVNRIDTDDWETFTASSAETCLSLLRRMTSCAVGMGMGQGGQGFDFLKKILDNIVCPAVLDADALNVLAEHADYFPLPSNRFVLTPHEGEMKRLLDGFGIDGRSFSRTEKALKLAELTNAVCLLKGPCTAIASPSGRTAVNLSGSPALATAGSGDVLSGIIASVIGRGYPLFDAVCAGVYLHGMLGEYGCQSGVIADDLLLRIGPCIEQLRKIRR